MKYGNVAPIIWINEHIKIAPHIGARFFIVLLRISRQVFRGEDDLTSRGVLVEGDDIVESALDEGFTDNTQAHEGKEEVEDGIVAVGVHSPATFGLVHGFSHLYIQ